MAVEPDTSKVLNPQKFASNARWRFALFTVWVVASVAIVVIVAWSLLLLINLVEDTNQVSLDTRRNTETIKKTSERLEHLVETSDAVLSPEALANSERRMKATIEVMLEIADCDNRDALQEVLDEIETADHLADGKLVLTCTQRPEWPTGE